MPEVAEKAGAMTALQASEVWWRNLGETESRACRLLFNKLMHFKEESVQSEVVKRKVENV